MSRLRAAPALAAALLGACVSLPVVEDGQGVELSPEEARRFSMEISEILFSERAEGGGRHALSPKQAEAAKRFLVERGYAAPQAAPFQEPTPHQARLACACRVSHMVQAAGKHWYQNTCESALYLGGRDQPVYRRRVRVEGPRSRWEEALLQSLEGLPPRDGPDRGPE